MNFDEIGLIAPIQTALAKIGVSEMTEIQEKAIPVLLQKGKSLRRLRPVQEKPMRSGSRLLRKSI